MAKWTYREKIRRMNKYLSLEQLYNLVTRDETIHFERIRLNSIKERTMALDPGNHTLTAYKMKKNLNTEQGLQSLKDLTIAFFE